MNGDNPMGQTTSKAIDNLKSAQQRAMAIRPKVGGFPVLAETLRQAGVHKNTWYLPAAESLYVTDHGPLVSQGTPLATGLLDVPRFDREAVIRAIRLDQAGESTFLEFLQAIWYAGVVTYTADFDARNVTYCGIDGDSYIEAYPEIHM
jgi:uncharacterized protein YbcV (DUF1398 family)